MHGVRKLNRKGQGFVEWGLILAFIALSASILTARTGTQVDQLFRTSSDKLGVEFRGSRAGEVVAARESAGGIAASGRTTRENIEKRSWGNAD